MGWRIAGLLLAPYLAVIPLALMRPRPIPMSLERPTSHTHACPGAPSLCEIHRRPEFPDRLPTERAEFRGWRRIRVGGCVIESELDWMDTEFVGRLVQLAQAEFNDTLGLEIENATVRVWGRPENYRAWAERNGGARESLVGLESRTVAVLKKSSGQLAAEILHGLAHLALAEKKGQAWLEEGLCAWISGAQVNGRRLSMGATIPKYVEEIRKNFSLAGVLRSYDGSAGSRAAAWAVVHFVAARHGTGVLRLLLEGRGLEEMPFFPSLEDDIREWYSQKNR